MRGGLLALILASGCASQTGLKSPGVERVCTKGICFIRAPRSVVAARCMKGAKTWDDGTPVGADPSITARCCAIYSPLRRRFRIWISEGEEECLPHEFCHVEQSLAPKPDHSKCHNFGLGRPKKAYE